MKSFQIVVLILIACCFKVDSYAQNAKRSISGTVHNWPTDTVYLQTFPFHSPYSNRLTHQLLTKDSSFYFEFEATEKPLVFSISALKEPIDNRIQHLLYQSLTDQHFYGHCIKFYTFGYATFLIEAGEELKVDITYNGYGETGLKFLNENNFKQEYFQKSFNLDNKLDKRLEVYRGKSIGDAILGVQKLTNKLVAKLDKIKPELGDFFYDYIRAEIEFGAKKEFLKHLRFQKEAEMDSLFAQGIPKEILDYIEFDKNSINDAILVNEEYNEYLELYLNFKLNQQNKTNLKYHSFNVEKARVAIRFLPEKSIYYYLSNQLLANPDMEKADNLASELCKRFPDGKLNELLLDL